MESPYIETYGLTETEFDQLQKITMQTLHPEIQEAIDTKGRATVDGDHYNATLEALSSLGFTVKKRMNFEDKVIKGIRYENATHTVTITKAEFFGLFTDVIFSIK